MFVVSNVSPRTWIIYAGVSLIVTLVIYFTVLKSTNDQIDKTTNAVNSQIDKVLKDTGAGAGASQIEKQAKKLADCVLAAGTDVSAAQACQTKFGG